LQGYSENSSTKTDIGFDQSQDNEYKSEIRATLESGIKEISTAMGFSPD
jgi:hypothetical protein